MPEVIDDTEGSAAVNDLRAVNYNADAADLCILLCHPAVYRSANLHEAFGGSLHANDIE